jgi:3',5'-cyclic AMP phosphodiesterase CpdA
MIRLVHISDIHLTCRPLGWRGKDFFTKRLPGWINLRWLGRAHRFRYSWEILQAFAKEIQAKPPDRIIFSGDATGLGFENELDVGTRSLGVNDLNGLPGFAVPGNHDYYTPKVAASGAFEKQFAPWQTGERIHGATYPFAQRVGPVWLIGVNSCKGNRLFWDATGHVDDAQLRRFQDLLKRLSPGLRVLVTHYPIARPNGEPERSDHCLLNLAELIKVATEGDVCLWLHGHQHVPYVLQRSDFVPITTIGAGSLTQTGHWSYFEYRLNQDHLQAEKRIYSLSEKRFEKAGTVEIRLQAPK